VRQQARRSRLDLQLGSRYTEAVSNQSSDSDGRAPELADAEAERAIEHAFREAEGVQREDPFHPVFGVIPEDVISASPEEFSAYLEGVLSDGVDLDDVLEHSLAPASASRPTRGHSVRAVVPDEALDHRLPDLFLDQLFTAFEEIDSVLSSLQGPGSDNGEQHPGHTVAVVPDHVIGDPEQLIKAIDRVRQARHSLRRLDGYRLSRQPPGRLIGEMRKARHLRTLQYLVEFLRSIHTAAESFERLELPRPHIKDYLNHLYRMEDWHAMAALVRRLERAVVRYFRDEAERKAEGANETESSEECPYLALDME